MKIAYVTGEVLHNGNFAFMHDLLGNFLPDSDSWQHRIVLLAPAYDDLMVRHLKNRSLHFEPCFEVFQPNTDIWWKKIELAVSGCDVVISGNISNLDDVIPDSLNIPVISVSLYEHGYRTESGGYGNFYKPRFHRVAVSKTAIEAFPEHSRQGVEVIYSGVDPSRIAPVALRETLREQWFQEKADRAKVILFIGPNNEDKGFKKTVEALNYLPNDYCIVVPTRIKDFQIPEHLHHRVFLCEPTFYIGDLYNASDVVVLPTLREGMNMVLKEAWCLGIPTVTTRHKSMLEMVARHPKVDFGNLVDVDVSPEKLAESIKTAEAHESATDCVHEHYMASNMVEDWEGYLERVIEKECVA